MSLETSHFSQLIISVISMTAGLETLLASWRSLSEYRLWRSILGVSVIFLSISYWMDLSHMFSEELIREVRRGLAFVLYTSVFMTSRSVLNFWGREAKRLQTYGEEIESG